MSDKMARKTPDECVICSEHVNDFRALDCGHMFCVVCLEKLIRRHQITCPHCRRVTTVPRGLKVTHLRKHVIPAHKSKVKVKPKVKVVTSWRVESQITSMKVDEDSGTVIVASQAPELRMYGYNGHYYGNLEADRDLSLARLAVDTKRGLILAADVDSNRPAIVRIDREGRQTTTVRCSHFNHLNAVSYHPGMDVYILADKGSRFLYYYDPRSDRLARRIPAPAPGEGVVGMCVACGEGSDLWATSDWGAGVVRLWDTEGTCVRAWTARGKGFGEFVNPSGVAISPGGGLLVSDATNQRLVSLTPPTVTPQNQSPRANTDSGVDSGGMGSGGSAVDSSGSSGASASTSFTDLDQHTDVCAWLDHVWPEGPQTTNGPGRHDDWAIAGSTAGMELGAPREIDITRDGLVVASMWNDNSGPFNVAVLGGVL